MVDELCPNLLTVPGIGYVTAGLIAGEIDDAERFHNAESLISFSGVDVTVYESGNYKAKHLIPSKKGSRYLRYALFQVARIIWMYDQFLKLTTKRNWQRANITMLFSDIFRKNSVVLFIRL